MWNVNQEVSMLLKMSFRRGLLKRSEVQRKRIDGQTKILIRNGKNAKG